jgi:hypothetical protein
VYTPIVYGPVVAGVDAVPAGMVTPTDGKAGASAHVGAYQHPLVESALVYKVTVTGSVDWLVSMSRPSLIPGNHFRNEFQSDVTVFVDPVLTGSAVIGPAVPSHRNRPPMPAHAGAEAVW